MCDGGGRLAARGGQVRGQPGFSFAGVRSADRQVGGAVVSLVGTCVPMSFVREDWAMAFQTLDHLQSATSSSTHQLAPSTSARQPLPSAAGQGDPVRP